jgi:hypothetical protein
MADAKTHRWQFAARFRRNAFGWRSQPAIERIREAVGEIRKAARRDPASAADGAVLFIEKVSPALQHFEKLAVKWRISTEDRLRLESRFLR